MVLNERVWYGCKASSSAIENLRTIHTENHQVFHYNDTNPRQCYSTTDGFTRTCLIRSQSLRFCNWKLEDDSYRKLTRVSLKSSTMLLNNRWFSTNCLLRLQDLRFSNIFNFLVILKRKNSRLDWAGFESWSPLLRSTKWVTQTNLRAKLDSFLLFHSPCTFRSTLVPSVDGGKHLPGISLKLAFYVSTHTGRRSN